MNYLDFIILYLTCGAPFAAEYFLRNRTSSTKRISFFKSCLILFFWLPYSIRTLILFVKRQNKNRNNLFEEKDETIFDEKKLEDIQKKMEKLALFANKKYSLFEFRDLFNRYLGLIFESKQENKIPSQSEQEIFTVSNRSQTNVSAICLHRRNRLRLLIHLKKSQEDFLAFLNEVFQTEFQYDKACLVLLAFELAVLLNDLEMQSRLRENFSDLLSDNFNLANDLLKPELWQKDLHRELQPSRN